MKRAWTSLFAALAIPLTSDSGWQVLSFSKIKPNVNHFSAEGLEVRVDGSAGPLVYALPQVKKVRAFRAELDLEGALKTKSGAFPDDAYLRVGLIVPGTRRLGWMERQIAAEWVRKLFALAPKGSGLDKVYFFNLIEEKDQIGKHRVAPGSKDLILERNIAIRGSDTHIVLKYDLPEPLQVAAVWIGTDGDNTQSAFTLKLRSLSLEIAD